MAPKWTTKLVVLISFRKILETHSTNKDLDIDFLP